MDIAAIKKIMIKNIIIVSLPLIIFICLFLFAEHMQDEYKKDISNFERRIVQLNNELQNVRTKAKEFAGSLRLWKQLDENKKDLVGLQITKAQEIIEKYKNEFLIIDMNSEFARPESLNEEFKRENAEVVSSKITINFKSINDVYALSFVGNILNDIPGYVTINKFVINRKSDVSDEILYNISQGKLVGLVDVKMELDWRDLQQLSTRPSNQSELEIDDNI